ncbi:MAG: chemotaxis protein CheW [Desulfonauticus sp.]|nr:chemotaxis protein CheW [Desulfonauticus sp.]
MSDDSLVAEKKVSFPENTKDNQDELLKFFSFLVGEEIFAFPMEILQEIIWVPETIKVPLTPPAFKGLTNLRGSILPIVDLRILFGQTNCKVSETTRAIIVDIGHPVGIIIDKVDKTLDVSEAQIDKNALITTDTAMGKYLEGVIKNGDKELVQIINIKKLLEQEFLSNKKLGLSSNTSSEGELELSGREVETQVLDELRSIITFLIGQEEFGLELGFLQEIIEYPEEIHQVPNAETFFLGVINYRNQVLPLFHIGELLGLDMNIDPEKSKILVVLIGNKEESSAKLIGIVVERVNEIVTVSEDEWSDLPAIMNVSSELGEVFAICKLDKGRRLISVLSVDALVDESYAEEIFSLTEELSKEQSMETKTGPETMEEEKQLVVFTLASQEYGIFIENIQEIILVPEKINKVPHTPDYIEGMINLRGGILPVIDMRKRLGEEALERGESQRILVLTIQGIKTGFIVDSVKEVLSIPVSKIETSPKMSERQAELMDKVINLEEQGRLILIINADKFLTEKEVNEIKDLGEE